MMTAERKLKFGPLLIILLAFCRPAVGGADNPGTVIDSLPADTLQGDSLPVIDTLIKASISDTSGNKRYYYDVNDSIGKVFLAERFDLGKQAICSFQHDAGDFFRSNPSYLIIENVITPSRKTVAPFGLGGNRVNVLFNRQGLHPVEYLPLPDNQIDFNDIPDGAAAGIYAVDGPLGMVCGGDNAVSSLILIPAEPDSTVPESRIVVDKGGSGYANTRALFSERTGGGRQFRALLEYRKAPDVPAYADDAYHQWGELEIPVQKNLRLDLEGRLYRRNGAYYVAPRESYLELDRSRRDRDLSASLTTTGSKNQSSSLQFRHQRSEEKTANYGATYFRNFDLIDNGLIFKHDFQAGAGGASAAVSLAREEYNEGYFHSHRFRGGADVKYWIGQKEGALITFLRLEKVKNFDPGFSSAIVYSADREKSSWRCGLAYATIFPRLPELDVRPKMARIFDSSIADYYEAGNRDLRPEKQLTGNMMAAVGSAGSDLTLSLTGGKIFDGIDWIRSHFDSANQLPDTFRIGNNDIVFGNVSLIKKIAAKKWSWSGGAAYRYIKIGDDDRPPYSPEYQFFTGLELRQYVQALDMSLYGYGEMIYAGSYYGYRGDKLGEKPIVNVKLSFQIKAFRFYYIFQDIVSLEYSSREDYTIVGRYNYFGFTWSFLN